MRRTQFEPIVIVVDASVLAPALGDDGASGDLARARLMSEDLSAPEIIDLEVVSALRGQVIAGKLAERRARFAITDLQQIPLERASHRQLLARCWALRANVTVYDAAYIALAELLAAPLVTADARLARAAGVRCDVEVLADPGRA